MVMVLNHQPMEGGVEEELLVLNHQPMALEDENRTVMFVNHQQW